ncbi:MAG: minor capsid protein, partial [Desulfovibrio sp.]|nr:minor capsid protein [Desulfovibrio sp.]
LTWDEAKELSEAARARAFYVTGLMQKDLVDKVSQALREALENGETLEEFKKRIPEIIQKQGWKDYRIETIFRTNMQTAYSAGRYAKMEAVKKTRPYWQYLAIMDKRTRPSHAVLHEKVYPADHEFWDSNYPPNGFRCRCAVRTLSERQVGSEGLTVEKEMPKPQFWTDPATNQQHYVQFPGAEKGFRNNPAKEWLEGKNFRDAPILGLDPAILQLLDAEAAKVNPDYYTDEGYKRNCQRCVLAYERRRRGENVEAMPNPFADRSGTSKRKIMNGSEAFKNAKVYGKNHIGGKAISKKDLERSLNLLPNGARTTIFWVNPDLKSGHAIVCEKVAGNLVFIDPQTGARGKKVLRQCYESNGYSWYRMDNLEFDETFEWNEATRNAR